MKALNVLVVDDAAFIRDLIKKSMRDGYPSFKIHEAVDGRKAQSILKNNPIDLVLCDWEMPEMSGLELITWMRAEERYAKTPFMMITSRGERDHVIKAVTAGVSDYIGKPFSRDSFLAKVNKLLSKHLGLSMLETQHASASAQDTSVAALMGGSTQASVKPTAKSSTQSSAALMGNPLVDQSAKPAAVAKSGAKAKGIAELRFGSGGSAKCVIKDINLQEMSGIFKREGHIPQLLEQVVLDIVDQDAGQVARINCYVRMLQAIENNADAATIKIVIRYVDDDPVKLDTLSRFIAKVR
ncbi:MAG: DNA-binding response OmpR family regulator [Oleispira sp.]|jgi:DNA-binding response OmpR family regulator